MRYLILTVFIFTFFFSSYVFSSDDLIKNNKRCTKFKNKYDSLNYLPLKIAGGDLADLRIDLLVEGCFNKSKECWRDAQLSSQALRKMYEDYWPKHWFNDQNFYNLSSVEQLQFKEMYQKAELNYILSDKRFRESCKKSAYTKIKEKIVKYIGKIESGVR